MKRRRVVGIFAASAVALAFLVTHQSAWVAGQDFPQSQNPAAQNSAPPDSAPQTATAPDLFPSPSNTAPTPLAPQPANDPAAPSDAAGADPNTETLTRGAIHEAFAQPVVFNASPGATVPQQPPEPVEELPPEQKPAGDHVVWIAGYWAWEQDQQKYVWTSGIWRSMPNGVEWVPGYWNQAEGGWQWVNGFWRKNDVTEVTYLPQKPPETLEQGPVGTAPTADNVWIPGHWVWRFDHYVWRPGFWAAANPDWIWVPAHYVWTPSGYVFCDGHWDFVMERRGVIFAPVVFRPGVVIGPGFVYSPCVAMDFSVCTGCLFCRPGFCCYCFGDYYGPTYASIGIYPWFAFHGRYGYDPCFAYYSWHYGPAWRERVVVDYRFRFAHIDARPPRTYALMLRVGGGGPALAMHINAFAARGGAMRFERINAARRQEIHRAVREQHLANARRGQMEARGARGAGGGPAKMNIPRSNLSAAHNQGGANQHAANQQRQQQSRQMQQQQQRRQPPRSNSRQRKPGER